MKITINLLIKSSIAFFVIVSSVFPFLEIKSVYAISYSVDPTPVTENSDKATITFTGLVPDREYIICSADEDDTCLLAPDINKHYSNHESRKAEQIGGDWVIKADVCGGGDAHLKFIPCGEHDFFKARAYDAQLIHDGKSLAFANIIVEHAYPKVGFCAYRSKEDPCAKNPKPGESLKIVLGGNRRPADDSDRNRIDIDSFGLGGLPNPKDPDDVVIPDGGSVEVEVPKDGGGLEEGDYLFNIRWDKEDFVLYQIRLKVDANGGSWAVDQSDPKSGGDGLTTNYVPPPEFEKIKVIRTPLGDIEVSPQGLASAILSLGIGVGGGLAFLLMVFGSYRLMFAGGNPEAIQQGREVITAAIAGLLVIIFSVFILRLIGINILGLPL